MGIPTQLLVMAILAIPVACIAWTATHEEIFREPREWLLARSKATRRPYLRKFLYLFTCEYCFSHYVTVAVLGVTRFQLVYPDWRGYLVAGFSMVWLANMYMSLFGRLRLDIKHEKAEIEVTEAEVEAAKRPTLHRAKTPLGRAEDRAR